MGKNFQLRSGFTLIELLVVITLLGIIGSITTQVFILGFRSQGKSEILKEVKQNGDNAMSIMENMIRNAADIPQPLNACFSNISTLTILNQDGNTTKFDCSTGSIASISGDPDGLPSGQIYTLTSNRVVIPSPYPVGDACVFRIVCPTPPLSPKYVFLSFKVIQAAVPGQPTPEPENRSSLDYQTTISLRGYQ